MEFLPQSTLRRIVHLQDQLVPKKPDRTPLSQGGSSTPRKSTTTALFDVPGRKQLLAAGDKIRDLIIPDALAQVVTAPFISDKRKDRSRDDAKIEAARAELDKIVSAVCPLCEGVIVGLDKPFIQEGEDTRDWDV
jgi:vacuolar protein sorting-associated protein 18